LEAVVQSWYEAEIADAPEMDTNDLCVRLRAAFPHLDAPPRALTAGEHIAALVELGAKRYDKVEAFTHHNGKTYQTSPLPRPTILVLPAEVTP
jgi:hypothetical protein